MLKITSKINFLSIDGNSKYEYLRDDSYNTTLMYAAMKGNITIVEELLARVITVNEKNDDENTALMYAADYGHTQVVNVLLNNGADVNSSNLNGYTALICAAQNGHTDTVKALLAVEGIKVNARDNCGDTALILAAQNGHTGTVNALLENSAEVNARNKAGSTALILAADNGDTATVSALLAKGAKVNDINTKENSALMLAAWKGSKDTVKALLAVEGIKVNAANMYGDTALISARDRAHTEIANLLIANGANRYWREFLFPATFSFVSLGLFMASIFIAAPLAAVVVTGLLFAVSTIHLSQVICPKTTASDVAGASKGHPVNGDNELPVPSAPPAPIEAKVLNGRYVGSPEAPIAVASLVVGNDKKGQVTSAPPGLY